MQTHRAAFFLCLVGVSAGGSKLARLLVELVRRERVFECRAFFDDSQLFAHLIYFAPETFVSSPIQYSSLILNSIAIHTSVLRRGNFQKTLIIKFE